MTKSLTEQWKEHNLDLKKNYYLKLKDGSEEIQAFHGGFFMSEDNEVVEVLDTVPSFDHFSQLVKKVKKLEQQLAIATKALKRIYQPTIGNIYNFETDELDHTKLQDIAYKALKEIEELGVK